MDEATPAELPLDVSETQSSTSHDQPTDRSPTQQNSPEPPHDEPLPKEDQPSPMEEQQPSPTPQEQPSPTPQE